MNRPEHHCWRCWLYYLWWLFKGIAWGWAVAFVDGMRFARRYDYQRRWGLGLAWMYWLHWYWPFYANRGRECGGHGKGGQG